MNSKDFQKTKKENNKTTQTKNLSKKKRNNRLKTDNKTRSKIMNKDKKMSKIINQLISALLIYRFKKPLPFWWMWSN